MVDEGWPIKRYPVGGDLGPEEGGSNNPIKPVLGVDSEGNIAQIDVSGISEIYHVLTQEGSNLLLSDYIFHSKKDTMKDALGNPTGDKIQEVKKKLRKDPDLSKLSEKEMELLEFGFRHYLLSKDINPE